MMHGCDVVVGDVCVALSRLGLGQARCCGFGVAWLAAFVGCGGGLLGIVTFPLMQAVETTIPYIGMPY